MGLGLPVWLAVSLLGAFSALLGFLLLGRTTVSPSLSKRAALYFGVTAASAPLLGPGFVYIAFSAIVAFLLAPKEIEVRRAFFIIAVFLFPRFYSFLVPFPGLNHLIDLPLWMILVARFLVPLAGQATRPITTCDILFFGFVFLVFSLDFRGVSITEGLRRGVVSIAWFLVPFLAFRNIARESLGRERVWEGLVVVAILLAAANIFIQLLRWDFFFFHYPMGVEIRFGLIRANTTLATGLFGFVCATAIVVLIQYPSLLKKGFLFRAVLYSLLVLGVFASGARAAILCLPLMLFMMFMLRVIDPRLVALAAAVTAAAHSVVIDLVLRADLSRFADPFNLEYRQRLLATSLEQIAANPIFGDQDFISHPRFLPLIQGQQMIDIVNSYLQIALEYGLLALLCYLGSFLLGIWQLSKKMKNTSSETKRCTVLLTVTVGYLFLIATTSMTSYVALLGVVLLGLIVAEIRPEPSAPIRRWRSTHMDARIG